MGWFIEAGHSFHPAKTRLFAHTPAAEIGVLRPSRSFL
jgi:hypothetical protein